MFKSFKSFVITFIVLPSLLGAALAFTVEILPLIWSIITQKGTSLAFKDLVITFILGYVMYLVYIVYNAIIHKFNKNKSH
ncbi:cellulose synthase/poly-beta-1,6-N-acetylglucosamine synthase-like glycosyltransferase [Bacillus pumilus]|uniref:hypothetical protein n=1 Tax=Bacillus pumilus TaxID=1408 RepID=UPI002406C9AF|nr:hypothetical protein [Bacillus pumilus]MCP1528003.1 cellulose synthase/poly-beta-1,6-N-acetylglucosamine synthase-like glycosyltransferase [Bacillus pumilus]MDF9783370.1 cellulose synthase/poly-beta-1,6-N-acetylglucosamine synthase-like glycosyltransferase [Bacillus pumilus]